MDPEAPVPNEAVADVHKALASGGPSSGGYNTMVRFQSDSQTLARGDEAARLKTPGGFRRHYLHGEAEAAGVPMAQRPATWRRSFVEGLRSAAITLHEAPLGMRLDGDTGAEVSAPKGTAGVTQTALAVMKSFVGSGITFLPAAFAEGGWLFSGPVLVFIALVNGLCIHLLLECRARTGCPSFGEIACAAVGAKGKFVVQVSIVVSQFGICIAYIIFIGQLAASMNFMRSSAVMFLQLILLIPLCLIRSVENMEYPNLVADILIVFGLAVVLVSSVMVIAAYDRPEASSTIVPFNKSTCGIFIGMSIFTFEGIPMVLPIQSAMKEPERFNSIFYMMFAGIVTLFTLFGLLGYVAWGNAVQTVVLLNLHRTSALTYVVKVGYMAALILSVPLMFLPGARITELWVFGVLKRASFTWEKNALRAIEVTAFALIAVKCQDYFDRFLAFTGAFCCAPIAFIYPTLFHLRLCAKTPAEKALDVFLILLGIAAVVVALYGSLA